MSIDERVAAAEPEVEALFAEDFATDYVVLTDDEVIRYDQIILVWPELKTWPAQRRRTVGMALHRWQCQDRHDSDKIGKVLSSLGRQRLGWTAQEVSWLFGTVQQRPWHVGFRLGVDARLPLAAAEALGGWDLRGLDADVRRLAGIVDGTERLLAADRRRICARLIALAERVAKAL